MTNLTNPLRIETILSDDGYLSIMLNGVPIGTIGEPSGPGDKSVFCVWEGTGLDEDDEEAEPIARIFTKNYVDVNIAWEEIVRMGCRMILIDHFTNPLSSV